ncbi:MAG: hypothetical protein KJ025_10255 [Burkholderiales bacterium]|nr:hypothetical protein [Burkholderiales bacterium]
MLAHRPRERKGRPRRRGVAGRWSAPGARRHRIDAGTAEDASLVRRRVALARRGFAARIEDHRPRRGADRERRRRHVRGAHGSGERLRGLRAEHRDRQPGEGAEEGWTKKARTREARAKPLRKKEAGTDHGGAHRVGPGYTDAARPTPRCIKKCGMRLDRPRDQRFAPPFAQVSRSVTARLNTGAPGWLSRRSATK